MDEKFIIASDIHGSAYWCEKLLEVYRREQPTKLVLLGDILYHGPRNPFPDGYKPQDVADKLNTIKDRIICVRGNCDSEVDQMVLNFPILADYALLSANGKTFFLTHGHLFSDGNPPPLSSGETLLNGHFHLPTFKRLDGGINYANCGSVALPKDGSPHSCVIFQGSELSWLDLSSGKVFHKVDLNRTF